MRDPATGTIAHPPEPLPTASAARRSPSEVARPAEYIARTPCRDIHLPRVDLVARPQLTADQLASSSPSKASAAFLVEKVRLYSFPLGSRSRTSYTCLGRPLSSVRFRVRKAIPWFPFAWRWPPGYGRWWSGQPR